MKNNHRVGYREKQKNVKNPIITEAMKLSPEAMKAKAAYH